MANVSFLRYLANYYFAKYSGGFQKGLFAFLANLASLATGGKNHVVLPPGQAS